MKKLKHFTLALLMLAGTAANAQSLRLGAEFTVAAEKAELAEARDRILIMLGIMDRQVDVVKDKLKMYKTASPESQPQARTELGRAFGRFRFLAQAHAEYVKRFMELRDKIVRKHNPQAKPGESIDFVYEIERGYNYDPRPDAEGVYNEVKNLLDDGP